MRQIVCATVLLVLTGYAAAGPIQTTDLAPGTRWVAHLDVEGLVASRIGQHFIGQAKAQQLDEKLKGFVDLFGFDPVKDLAGITIYGTDYEPASGVAIFKGRFDPEKLIGLVQLNPRHQVLTYGNYTIQSWTEAPREAGDDGVRFGTFHSPTTLVITRSENMLQKVLDVLDGKVTGQAVALTAVSPGTLLVVAGEGFPIPSGPQAEMLKKVSSGKIEFGESPDANFLKIRLTAQRAEDAKRIRQMASGLFALLSMAAEQTNEAGQPPYWAPLVEGADVSGTDTAAELAITVKTAALIKFVEEDARLKAAAAQAAGK